jgi:molybdenum cofactor guanylyltransferase
VTRAATWCGVLLAGGASSRFGGVPKGIHQCGGQRLADYSLGALSAVCDEIVVAANDPCASDWFPQHRIVADQDESRGGLAALVTALRAADGHNLLVCAWDMPLVSVVALRGIQRALLGDVVAVVPLHANGGREPLCAAYRSSLLPIGERLMAQGERAAHALTAGQRVHDWVIETELPHGAAQTVFFNVNTPADLSRAEQWLTAP